MNQGLNHNYIKKKRLKKKKKTCIEKEAETFFIYEYGYLWMTNLGIIFSILCNYN